ncbi:Ig heavy chain V region 914 [Silurus meridionalis]|nr:Ig heavy chain V region 914 [Silurus meridionalis]
MLRFRRAPLLLKEFFHLSLKRPLVQLARRHHANAPGADGRLGPNQVRRVLGSGCFSHPPAWRRTLCTKTEGVLEPGEQLKKDGALQEAATDNSYIYYSSAVKGRFTISRDNNSYGQSMTSSAYVVKRPGESVTLYCTVSGFSMSSYYMHWIRQKPGRGLEWIGRIDTGTSTAFAQSLQGQFSITKDTNKNMVYLEVKSLKAEDTAVYYCARDSH